MGDGEVEMEFCGNPVCQIAPPKKIVGVIKEVDFCKSSFLEYSTVS